MFSDSLKFNDYVQPDIEEWVKSQNADLNYDQQKFTLNSGTLLIQFYDRRQNRSIWQGYATTVYGGIDFHNNRHLKNAVIGRAAVSGEEVRQRCLTFVVIKAAGIPAQIGLASKSERLVCRLDRQRHRVAEAENLFVFRVEPGLIAAGRVPREIKSNGYQMKSNSE